MTQTRRATLFGIALAFCGTVAASQPSDSPATRARALITSGMRESQIPGLLVAVAVHGNIVWSEAFGYADLERRAAMTRSTRSRVGSISKSITAAALMKLRESRKIDLEATLHTYVPSFPAKSFPVTITQLAGHLGGIRHYAGNEFVSRVRYESVEGALAVFAQDSLLFRPGTRFNYSTYGYTLLSAAIERAANQPFLDYVQSSVLKPLGMVHTLPDFADSTIADRASFYDRMPSGDWQPATRVDNSNKWAGGGYLSNAEDLVRFGSALLKPGYLTRESLDLMFTSQRLLDGAATGYGIGWYVSTDSAAHRVVLHGGTSIGATAALVIHREEGIVVAVLVNTTASRFTNRATEEIAHLFLAARLGSRAHNSRLRYEERRYSPVL